MTAWSEADIQTLKTLAAAGASRNRIAVRLKRSVNAVKREALKQGIELKSDKEVRKSNGLSPHWVENRTL